MSLIILGSSSSNENPPLLKIIFSLRSSRILPFRLTHVKGMEDRGEGERNEHAADAKGALVINS